MRMHCAALFATRERAAMNAARFVLAAEVAARASAAYAAYAARELRARSTDRMNDILRYL
jgi:hypothetical protein